MAYTFTQIIHLFCAILFIGVVFFEVVLLEGMRKTLPESTMTQVETGLINRAKTIMPWVVGTLFISGILMGYHHFSGGANPLQSSFHTMLALKILLAISVLVHFVTALRSASTGCMDSSRFQKTHLSVAIHMVLIVLLAKLMFVLHW